ncbi:LppP/LprE family lipoprotein [Rhodococcoides kroppenstedtii]|uniref:LppP/LprE family lipoprotein n=1 Tax=Rhodococcoides kroppenstedtii TaxID=293050 RepID=UPI001BDDD950|nr:LppP/LprE family lipoprotein [Rhodococcus kroppenstedtii]MBT1192797.1 LppP/LprE family lipoprotein [Rhodococcus kroppenstedtii]
MTGDTSVMTITTGAVRVVVLAACAAVAAACGGQTGGTALPAPADPTTSVAAAPSSTPAAAPSASDVPTPGPTFTETVTVPAPAPAGPVPCVDPSSSNVRAAVADLGTDSQGGRFVIDDHTTGISSDGCPSLEWARATGTGIQNGTVQSHVLFFTNTGSYLGTATSDAYSYTSVVGASDDTVTVRYRWLSPDDAICCPSNESYVTFTLVGGNTIVPDGQFPPRP